MSRSELVRVEGAWYSVPSSWAGLRATAYVGVDDVELSCRDERVVHPRQSFGGRLVRYRHYLGELARKPQAVRQVAPELVAELGEPFGRLWAQLVPEQGAHDAARTLARLLRAVGDHGEERVREVLERILDEAPPAGRFDELVVQRLLVTAALPAEVALPPRLRGYEVESASAAATASPSSAPTTSCASLAARRRRAGLRALRACRRRAALQPARRPLRAALDDRHHQPPFSEWVQVFGDEKLTIALLDRLGHHAHILTARGPSYRTRRQTED